MEREREFNLIGLWGKGVAISYLAFVSSAKPKLFFICSFIHLFNKCLMRTCYTLGMQ